MFDLLIVDYTKRSRDLLSTQLAELSTVENVKPTARLSRYWARRAPRRAAYSAPEMMRMLRVRPERRRKEARVERARIAFDTLLRFH